MDRKAALMISLGFEIVGVILVAVYVGGWLDEKYQWGGLGLIGAFVIGFAGWLTHVLMIVKTFDKPSDSNDQQL